MQGFKFGLFAFSAPSNSQERGQLLPGFVTLPTRVGDLFKGSDVAHWREWVGSIEWENLERCNRVAIRIMPSMTAEIDDGENRDLYQGANNIRNALVLAGPNGFVHGAGFLVAGEANGAAVDAGIKTIRNFGPSDNIVRPYYCGHDAWWETEPYKATEAPWVDRWRRGCELTQGTLPRLLFYGFLAMVRAMEAREIEFKIPDCVRAAESVLGLPAGREGGRGAFASRVLGLFPDVEQDPFVGGAGLHESLRQLYDHRNECVHGKIPFRRLQQLGERGAEEAAKFEYLAEMIARRCLLFGLAHANAVQLFSDRAQLEQAWREKRVS